MSPSEGSDRTMGARPSARTPAGEGVSGRGPVGGAPVDRRGWAMGAGHPTIRVADADGLEHARRLFRADAAESAASIGAALCFQGFEDEVAGLPGRYAPPSGCLLLASEGGRAAGC